MEITITLSISILLGLIPLLIAVFFLQLTVPRKLLVIQQDLRKLNANAFNATALPSQIAPEPDVEVLMRRYFSPYTLVPPALLVSVFYVVGFLFCDCYLAYQYGRRELLHFFPIDLVLFCRPVLYTFVGVYLFNLGTMIRRVYLTDLNEQVFWGALNRFLLSMGISLIFLKTGIPGGPEAGFYFSVGFISNIFLDWILDNTLKILNVGKPKQSDLPLQMVRGIDIWKEYRLEEEGIENVQNLATADVIDLSIRTHYSLRTLIDWIDQAILLTRLAPEHVKALGAQAIALSAIEMAAASPEAKGNSVVCNAFALKLSIDPALMEYTMNSLYEDQFVRDLWLLWQSGREDAGGATPSIVARAAQVGGTV